jgi:hypothetical protein
MTFNMRKKQTTCQLRDGQQVSWLWSGDVCAGERELYRSLITASSAAPPPATLQRFRLTLRQCRRLPVGHLRSKDRIAKKKSRWRYLDTGTLYVTALDYNPQLTSPL